MIEVATTIIELIGNLLDPAAYVIGVIGNAYGRRTMDRQQQDGLDAAEIDEVQVRIGIVGPGRVPAYRIESAGALADCPDQDIIGVFDGERHVPLATDASSAELVRWSDTPTPVSDVERLHAILQRFGSAGIR